MIPSPLTVACMHLPSPEELRRDRSYRGCAAQPGEPCTWARRYDGLSHPPFHSERIETALTAPYISSEAPEQVDVTAAILDTGLV